MWLSTRDRAENVHTEPTQSLALIHDHSRCAAGSKVSKVTFEQCCARRSRRKFPILSKPSSGPQLHQTHHQKRSEISFPTPPNPIGLNHGVALHRSESDQDAWMSRYRPRGTGSQLYMCSCTNTLRCFLLQVDVLLSPYLAC